MSGRLLCSSRPSTKISWTRSGCLSRSGFLNRFLATSAYAAQVGTNDRRQFGHGRSPRVLGTGQLTCLACQETRPKPVVRRIPKEPSEVGGYYRIPCSLLSLPASRPMPARVLHHSRWHEVGAPAYPERETQFTAAGASPTQAEPALSRSSRSKLL